ncbi:bromodomain-containing protein 3 [Drosophila biarmipes]|uniref:bromodomain-containing protein 3 n=1 Tax=Drosophila biarmipes TaxID=125945 RepID=UPI0007E8495A|nr:bromodomain-containing protein 3 [Drosophila biarmipes]XP_043946890.1 bromodomain-containing protein 3 [Drosophila biarmipes]XP_043946891.1 bromodomain-containing protein 3 [Drosophila biarmipes]
MDRSKLQKPQPPPRYEPEIQPVNGIVQPPVIPPPNRPGRQTNVLEDLKSLVNWIFRHRCSVFFRNPVDTVSFAIPDYHKMIKHPMDLNTIKKRLCNNYYWQADEALHDFELIFENCFFYNNEASEVYQACKELKSIFYSRLALIDRSNESELPPKVEKRKRKAADACEPFPASTALAPRGSSHFPAPLPGSRLKGCSTPNPEQPFSNFVMPKLMQDTLINPLTATLPFPPQFKDFHQVSVESHLQMELTEGDSPPSVHRPPITHRPIVLPPPLTTAPLEPIMKAPSPPPALREPSPPKPKPPVVICYKSLDRLIEMSHCVHLLKSMVKRKRKEFTWPCNHADYWKKYSQNPNYNHDKEEKLDWNVLRQRLDRGDFESFDGFLSSVRRMFQNALRCFPEGDLVKTAVKRSSEVFESRLLKYRELIATAKEKARALVEGKKDDREAAETKGGQLKEYELENRQGFIKMHPIDDDSD